MYNGKINDLHVHANSNIESSKNMFARLKSQGVENINLACLTYLEYAVETNHANLYYKATEKGMSVFGGLYYNDNIKMPYLEQAKMLLYMGCDGIKSIEMKPNYNKFVGKSLDSAEYDQMFDFLEKEQVPVLCHAADPETFWDPSTMTEQELARGWCYKGNGFLTKEAIYESIINRLNKNPNLKIVFAHFFFTSNDIDFAYKMFEDYKNIGFDLTPGWEMYVGFAKRIEEWQKFFIKYSDRIYFGTDNNSELGEEYGNKIYKTVRSAIGNTKDEFVMPHRPVKTIMRGLDLPEEAQENIAYKNFERLIGTPKKVDVAMLKASAKEFLSFTQDQAGKRVLDCIINEL